MIKRIFLIMLMTMTTAAIHSQDFDFDEVTYTPEATTFRLFAPADAKKVTVRIYRDGLGGKALKTVKMNYADGIWQATVKGDLTDRFYTFDMSMMAPRRPFTPTAFANTPGHSPMPMSKV